MELGFGALYTVDLPLDKNLFKQYSHLLPESLNSAIESRKSEFIAGRYCAIKAAEQLGIELIDLPMGKNREPLWPTGLVGSISHTKGIAMALVDKVDSSKSVGLDVEALISESKTDTIERMVATKKDLAFLGLFKKKLLVYSVLFSAKEALYKMIYPLSPVFFGFKEAELKALDLDERAFVLEITSDRTELQAFKRKFTGHFFETDQRIVSILRIKS